MDRLKKRNTLMVRIRIFDLENTLSDTLLEIFEVWILKAYSHLFSSVAIPNPKISDDSPNNLFVNKNNMTRVFLHLDDFHSIFLDGIVFSNIINPG